MIAREATRDTEIAGTPIAKGDWLMLHYTAANLDPRHFPDPLRFDVTRANANKQIADQLGITEDTVKGRVKSILSKLDANDRTHAAIIGLRRGII